MNKHNVEYYLALKREDILSCATTQMNLEDTVLSEMTQSQKDKYYEPTYMRYLKQ